MFCTLITSTHIFPSLLLSSLDEMDCESKIKNNGGGSGMRSFSVQNQMESLSALVQRLLAEHRDFSSKSQALDHSISKSEFASVSDIILSLRESLIDHMLVEE